MPARITLPASTDLSPLLRACVRDVKRRRSDEARAQHESAKRSYRMQVDAMFLAHKLPLPLYEFVFHPDRDWRFDMAWDKAKLALEIDGGTFGRGKPCPVMPTTVQSVRQLRLPRCSAETTVGA